ncbi:MAG: glutathione S-transferase [Cellvibrionaceae bacterium]|jgi:glutathione S-transferase
MKAAGIEFEEIKVELYSPDGKQQLLQYTDAGKVPVLIDNDIPIWDSLAIAEYLVEHHPEKALWPLASDSRAIARASVTAEMHSSFNAIRGTLPMNCRRSTQYENISPELQKEIDRICKIWKSCCEEYGEQGDFLFGKLSIADAFYAPVVVRLNGYNINAGKIERQYMDNILVLSALQAWIKEAKQEKTVVEAYELTQGAFGGHSPTYMALRQRW